MNTLGEDVAPFRVMILGASHSEISLYSAAVSMGYEVIGVAARNIHDDVRAMAHQIVLEDFSQADRVLDVFREMTCSHLAAGCNDFAAKSVAKMKMRLGVGESNALKDYRRIHDKAGFRELGLALGIPMPKLLGSSDLIDLAKVSIPSEGKFLFKPRNLSGGKGISIIDQNSSLSHLIAESSQSDWLIEEFVPGTLHSLFCLVQDQQIQFTFLADEDLVADSYLVNQAIYPSKLDEDKRAKVSTWIQEIVDFFQIQIGVLHLQFIDGPDGPVAIELTQRPPGDCYLVLMDVATDSPVSAWTLRALMGLRTPTEEFKKGTPVSDTVFTRRSVFDDAPAEFHTETEEILFEIQAVSDSPRRKTIQISPTSQPVN